MARSKATNGAAYGEDLAAIHDAGFSELSREAARALISILRRRGAPSGLVVELGCGSGILARELTKTGRPVLGVDISPAMIRLARKRAPRARFRVNSFRTAVLPRCAAVAAIGEVFSYRFDGRADLAPLLRRIHRALEPGGVLLFDVAAPGRVKGAQPVRKFVEREDWAVFVTLEQDARRRILTRTITSFRRLGRGHRRTEEVHRQRLFRRTEVEKLLRAAGFEVRTLAGYGRSRFPRGQIGFLARKRSSASSP
jgi:SAM-dependent methyltransferase